MQDSVAALAEGFWGVSDLRLYADMVVMRSSVEKRPEFGVFL
jgi:hypothetical protein